MQYKNLNSNHTNKFCAFFSINKRIRFACASANNTKYNKQRKTFCKSCLCSSFDQKLGKKIQHEVDAIFTNIALENSGHYKNNNTQKLVSYALEFPRASTEEVHYSRASVFLLFYMNFLFKNMLRRRQF